MFLSSELVGGRSEDIFENARRHARPIFYDVQGEDEKTIEC